MAAPLTMYASTLLWNFIPGKAELAVSAENLPVPVQKASCLHITQVTRHSLNARPWKHFKWISVLATITMVAAYIFFSPLGVAKSDNPKTIEYGIIIIGIVFAFVLFGAPLLWRKYSARKEGDC